MSSVLREWAGKLTRAVGDPGAPLYPARPTNLQGVPPITADDAMRNSAVWAALRRRANAVSMLDMAFWRSIQSAGDTLLVPVGHPPIFDSPSTDPNVTWAEWLYSSQVDLDRFGNTFGLIKLRDALGFPKKIDLVPAGDVRVCMAKDGTVSYKIGRTEYPASDVWHERDYTVAGLPVGLSPLTNAALTISQHKSAQMFSINWFTNNAMPAGILKNTGVKIKPDEAQAAKNRFKAALQGGGDVFVTGNDWEFNPVTAQSNDSAWLSSMGASATDIARFLDVPGDLIDAPTAPGTSIVYANIVQRFTQFLTVHLAPALQRRQATFSRRLMSAPRFCEFDTAKLLRMDPASLSTMLGQQIKDRIRTPTEVRSEFYHLPPLTGDDLAEFVAAFGKGPAEQDATVAEGIDATAGLPANGGTQ